MKITVVKNKHLGEVVLTRSMIISLLPGVPCEFMDTYFTRWCGNQWNEDYYWDNLDNLSNEELADLYLYLCNYKTKEEIGTELRHSA